MEDIVGAMTGALQRQGRDVSARRPQRSSRSRPTRCPGGSASWAGSSAPIGLILIGLIVVFSLLEYENFVSVSNGRNITTDAAVLLVLAVGSTS
jgi:hypothetical protein